MADNDIITGTSEEIGVLVLRWARLEEIWDQHELGWEYNPTRDVVKWCNGDGLDVDPQGSRDPHPDLVHLHDVIEG